MPPAVAGPSQDSSCRRHLSTSWGGDRNPAPTPSCLGTGTAPAAAWQPARCSAAGQAQGQSARSIQTLRGNQRPGQYLRTC